MSLADDLRNFADLIDAEPALATELDKNFAGGNFVTHAPVGGYGDACNTLRRYGPVKVGLATTSPYGRREPSDSSYFSCQLGGVQLQVMKR